MAIHYGHQRLPTYRELFTNMRAVSAYYAGLHPDNNWVDAYGIWFAGSFGASIESKHHPETWACLDTKHEKLPDGEHECTVWDRPGLLVFWHAQGYPRGLIVPAGEESVLNAARKIAETKPWSFTPLFELRSHRQ